MSRPATFRQSDLSRALDVVKSKGVHSWRLRFPPEGGFEILPAEPAPEHPTASPLEAWEKTQRGDRAA